MRFKIKYRDDQDLPPLPGAVKSRYVFTDRRTFSDPSQFESETCRFDWFAHGANHRIENNMIARELSAESWFIEITTIDQLMDLVKISAIGEITIDEDGAIDIEGRDG